MKLLFIPLFLTILLCSCTINDRRGDGYYSSNNEAVMAAFDSVIYRSINRDIEYGGIIYKDNKGYFYTVAMGTNSGDALSFTPSEFNADVVSMWHTHGNSSTGFSEQDLAVSDRICIDSYMMNNTKELFLYKGCEQ